MKCKATESQIDYYLTLLNSIFGIPNCTTKKDWCKTLKKYHMKWEYKIPKELVLYQKTFKGFPNKRKLKKIDKKLMCQLIKEAAEYHKNEVDKKIAEFIDVFYQLD